MTITDQDIKKLARLSIQEGEINDTIAEFVLQKLTTKQLAIFIKYLKVEISKQTIYVQTAEKESIELEKKLVEYFVGQKVLFKSNESLGAGLKIQQDDIIIDLTLKNMINNTVKILKSEL